MRTDLHLFYEATRLPVAVFCGDSAEMREGPTVLDAGFLQSFRRALPEEVPGAWYSCSPEFVYAAGLRLPEGKEILLGPVLPGECSRKQAEAIGRVMGRPRSDTPLIREYFLRIGMRSVTGLLSALRLLLRLLSLPEPEEIPLLPFQWEEMPPSAEPLPDVSGAEQIEQVERAMFSGVQSGSLDALNRLIGEWQGFREFNDGMDLEKMRACVQGGNMFCSVAALRTGLEREIVYALREYHAERIRAARSTEDLSETFFELLQDYTRRVRDMKKLPSASPVVQSVHHYICTHYDEKITPHTLAQSLHLSVSYLCSHFKQETGSTIADYVRKIKLEEARRLLQGSDRSVVEISEALGFSSQSYFCATFKKETGQTPQAFRRGET